MTTVERQVIAWFEVDDEQRFKDNFPISIISDEKGVYYVFPPFDHPGLKVGHGPRIPSDDTSQRAFSSHAMVYHLIHDTRDLIML